MSSQAQLPFGDGAWQLLRQALRLRAPYVAERRTAALTIDQQLAAYVLARPGELETRALAGMSELAAERGDGDRTLLQQLFLASWRPPTNEHPLANLSLPLPALFAATTPMFWLNLFAVAYRDHPEQTEHFGFGFLHELLRRAGMNALHELNLPQEAKDLLFHRLAGHPLPDLLPEIAMRLSAENIESILTRYTGRSLSWMQARLVKQKHAARSTKKAPKESLAERIALDLQSLAKAKVSRSLLADRITLAADLARYESNLARTSARLDAVARNEASTGSLEESALHATLRDAQSLRARMGTPPGPDQRFPHLWVLEAAGQPRDIYDPIHPLWRHTAQEYLITRKQSGAQLKALAVAPLWIRRLCFFGGARYRVDPTLAVQVLL